jgi:hypothetical protein
VKCAVSVRIGYVLGTVMHSDPVPLTARRGGPLTGRAQVPGDKSISIRALILGALAVGETRITGMLEGEDALSTAKAMQALGAQVARAGMGQWRFRHRLPAGAGRCWRVPDYRDIRW